LHQFLDSFLSGNTNSTVNRNPHPIFAQNHQATKKTYEILRLSNQVIPFFINTSPNFNVFITIKFSLLEYWHLNPQT